MAEKTFVIDTNALLNNPAFVEDKGVVIILDTVLRELRKLEQKKNDQTLQYQLRRAKRVIEKGLEDNLYIVETDTTEEEKQYADPVILDYVKDEDYILVTDDIGLKHMAIAHGVETQSVFKSVDKDAPKEGVVEFVYDPENEQDILLLSKITEMVRHDMYFNPFDMVKNQYLVVRDITDKSDGYRDAGLYKFNGVSLKPIRFKSINNKQEKIKPINTKQRLAFDLMQDEETKVKLLLGGFGVGKTHLGLAHAIDGVLSGKFDKIIWIRNNVEVKDSNEIGFLPDGLEAKLFPFVGPLVDKLGGEDGYNHFKDRVEIQHLGFLRGREFKNSIIYVTEGQSMTRDHIKLILGRAGEGTEVWVDGDTRQSDHRKFENDNAIKALKDLTGNELFGQVELDKVERSDTANLANLLD